MKRKSKSHLLAASLIAFALLAFTNVSYGDTVFGNGALTTTDLTFDNPNGSSAGSGIHYYEVFPFSVTAAGAYTFELSSMNTTGSPSNALDTFVIIYANMFDPLAPGGQIGFDDDFTGVLSVLSGSGTGFTGALPASQLLNLNLMAGTPYFMVITSFRETTFVGTGTVSQATGLYNYGITGPGIINVVPEPATTALLVFAAGGLGILALRKRRAA
jgi:hypothetical protein